MSSTAAADSCEAQEEQGTTTVLGAAVSVAHRKRDPEISGDCSVLSKMIKVPRVALENVAPVAR